MTHKLARTMIAALAVGGLVLIVTLAAAQERQFPKFLEDDCVRNSDLLAILKSGGVNAWGEVGGWTPDELEERYEAAACDCTDLRSSIAYIEDHYERRDFRGIDFGDVDVDKYHIELIDLTRRKFNQQCDEWLAAQACIIAGEYGGKTMGLGARPLEGDADSRIFAFVDEAAVKAAQSFVKELNKLDHEGDLPSQWELRCEQ